MGGNTTIQTKSGKSVSAERIPLKEIGRKEFVSRFQDFLINMNKSFRNKYGYYIWNEQEIFNGGIFNGSTSFIMNPDFDSDEIVKYKPTAGDLDIAFNRDYAKDVYNFLESVEDTSYAEFSDGIKYIGNNANSENKLGNTIICIVKAQFGDITVQAQMDLELSEFSGDKQSIWSSFSHSSDFEDAKAGIKGVFNKHFWRALVGSLKQVNDNFVVVTPSSSEKKYTLKKVQPKSIRLLNFGVDSGVGAGYELMNFKIDNKDVYRQKKPNEKTYDKNLENLLMKTFGTTKINVKDTHSFIKVLGLCNKYLDKNTKQKTLSRFLEILFCNDNGQCQEIEPDYKEDVMLKKGAYLKAVELLKLKEDKNLDIIIKNYISKKFGITESFRNYLDSL